MRHSCRGHQLRTCAAACWESRLLRRPCRGPRGRRPGSPRGRRRGTRPGRPRGRDQSPDPYRLPATEGTRHGEKEKQLPSSSGPWVVAPARAAKRHPIPPFLQKQTRPAAISPLGFGSFFFYPSGDCFTASICRDYIVICAAVYDGEDGQLTA